MEKVTKSNADHPVFLCDNCLEDSDVLIKFYVDYGHFLLCEDCTKEAVEKFKEDSRG